MPKMHCFSRLEMEKLGKAERNQRAREREIEDVNMKQIYKRSEK